MAPHLWETCPLIVGRPPLISIAPSGQSCGAAVTGVDLSKPLTAAETAEIRAAWLSHHVLAFPDQSMTDDDLERFTVSFGGFGHDPFIAPIPGRSHVIAVQRLADERSPLFAENWHSDWSFQARPPAGTCLYGLTIPPVGGDTLFSNQHAALDAMPAALRVPSGRPHSDPFRQARLRPGRCLRRTRHRQALHGYPPVAARPTAAQLHPLIRRHPETGREGLFGCFGYIIGIEGMPDTEAVPLLTELYQWQGREEFQYRHKWRPNMLVMWDNRSVLHAATGGYDGYDRVLHRTTIAAWSGTDA